jgi:hypothetical protein
MGDCKIAQKIVLLLQNKETWCRCQWFWGFQRAEGFSKSLGRCTALIFCGFRFALGKRVAWMQSGQQKIGAGWFASGALIAFQRAERFSKPLGRCTAPWAKILGGLLWQCKRVVLSQRDNQGLCKRRFSIWQWQINPTIAASKICGTKFKEKKNK